MSTRLVIVSDTHVPQRARALPGPLWAAIEAADVVIHAGDWNGVALLDEFERRSARLLAVYGNDDGEQLRARLPAYMLPRDVHVLAGLPMTVNGKIDRGQLAARLSAPRVAPAQ